MSMQMPSLYNPLLQTNYAMSPMLQAIQKRRQERLMKDIIPAVQPKVGMVQQFIYGSTAPVTGLAAKMNIIRRPEREDPQGAGEKIAKFIGNIVGYGALLGTVLNPLTGALTAGTATAVQSLGYSALAGKVAGAAASGAAIGGVSAWLDEEDVGKSMLTRGLTSAAFPLVGAGVSKLYSKIKPPLVNPLEALVQKGVTMPTSAKEMDTVMRLMKHVPQAFKQKAYQDTLTDILDAMQPGQALENMTQAQVDYFTGQLGGISKDIDKDVRVLLGVLRHTPGGDEFAKNIIDTTGQAQYGPLMKATGRARDLIDSAMRKIDPADVPAKPVRNVQFTKAAMDALDKVESSENLYEQLSYAEKFYENVRQSYHRFMKRRNYESLEAMLQDPNLKKTTLNAAQRHMQKRDMAQELLWNIKGKLHEELGMLDPKDVPSTILSKAFAEAPGTRDVFHTWHPNLLEVLKKANDKLGRSYSNYEDMLADYNLGNTEVSTYMTMWNDTKKAILDKGDPTYVGMYSTTLVPLPEDIEARVAVARTKVIPRPKELDIKPSTPEIAALHKKLETAWQAKVRAQAEYGVIDYVRDLIDAGEVVPASLHDEMILQQTSPFRLFSKLIPIRHLMGKDFTNAARAATTDRMLFNDKFLGLKTGLKEWMRIVDLKGSDLAAAGERIGDFLENPNLDQTLLEKVYGLADDSPEFQNIAQSVSSIFGLSPKELRIAANMRNSFIEIFKLAGLGDDQFIEAYFPHFRRMTPELIKEIQTKVAKVADENIVIKGVNWLNALERTGNLSVYEGDAFKAFARYINGAGKHIFYDDLFREWTAAFEAIGGEVGKGSLRGQTFEQIKQYMLGRPTHFEAQVDDAIKQLLTNVFHKDFTEMRPSQAVSSFITEMQIMGGLGLNPFAVAKNLTQKILFLPQVADEPEQWMTNGIDKWFKYKQSSGIADVFNPILQHRMFTEGMTYSQSAIVNAMTSCGVDPKTAYGVQEVMLAGYKWSDYSNVKDAFGTQFLSMLDKGAPLQEAFEIATSTAMSTQFMYGLDSPMLYKTPFGRLLGVFMSWPLNWAMMLYEQGTQGEIRQAFATVGAMAIGSAALSLTGYNFMATHPAAVAQGILPIALMEGQESWPAPLRTGTAIMESLRALSDGDEAAIASAFENLKRRIEPMYPAGVAVGRVTRFIDMVKNDWKEYDMRQRFRRDVPVREALQSIFGPTVQAQQRYQDYLSIQRMESDYKRLRAKAIQAYMNEDIKKFRYLQEQLLANYGKFIEPQDIQREVDLRGMSAVERQLIGLPEDVKSKFMEERGYIPTTTERRNLRRITRL